MVTMPPMTGIAVRRTISNGEQPAVLLTAMMTPATGEIERPMPAMSCIGRIMVTALTPYLAGDKELVRTMVNESAAKYAAEKKITPRDCSKEG